jgi:hypothetical protein
MATLATLGVKPTIVDGTIKTNGVASLYNSATNTITWDPTQVAASGQDPTQILFHELAHAFYDYGKIEYSGPATASAGPYTITYDFSQDTQTNPAVSNAYYHLFVDNDTKSAFGTDTTGALLQAFGLAPDSGGVVDQPVPGVTIQNTQTGQPVTNPADIIAAANAENSTPLTGSLAFNSTLPGSSGTFTQAMNANGSQCPGVGISSKVHFASQQSQLWTGAVYSVK